MRALPMVRLRLAESSATGEFGDLGNVMLEGA